YRPPSAPTPPSQKRWRTCAASSKATAETPGKASAHSGPSPRASAGQPSCGNSPEAASPKSSQPPWRTSTHPKMCWQPQPKTGGPGGKGQCRTRPPGQKHSGQPPATPTRCHRSEAESSTTRTVPAASPHKSGTGSAEMDTSASTSSSPDENRYDAAPTTGQGGSPATSPNAA